ncbi:MAG: hypothetical protein E7191_04345 [Erysipelotrichaceae bacterium]|nr:hypothetical protein [Erysipelotrichaceae bacterium]MBR3693317.1 hypothetical protein [Erysipelotrichales bacterium]
MNPINFQNPMYPEEFPYQQGTYPNYAPYIKQPLPPRPIDKRNVSLPICDLLKQNVGSVVNASTIHASYKGVIEYCSEQYFILHDPKSRSHTILFFKDLIALVFEDDIQYLST